MARCRCIEGQCGCHLRAGLGTTVTGDGSAAKPWVVSAIATVQVGHGLDGIGTSADPIRIDLCSYDDLKAACAS